ncbi:hypothetical protein SAMN06298216_0092 [Spirosomataceae bacterium TFI 002]|nr:hypothetical protein SAMN06298216_0092 [Spirosomataceae bacterium TFI 002]
MKKKISNISPNEKEFEAPSGYFDNLESNLFDKISKKGFILESNIPFPFNAPEGYFAQLEEDVFDQTIRIQPQLKITHKRNFAPWYRIAAALLIASGFSFWYFGQGEPQNEMALADISNEEILAYLGEQELNTDDIYSLFPEEVMLNDVSEDEMLDYVDVDMLTDI